MSSRVGALFIFWTVSLALGQPPPKTPSAPGLEGVNPDWLVPTERRIEEQIRFLTSAYDLDEAGVAALREEMQRRLVAQVPMERAYQREKIEWLRKTKREGRKGEAYEEDRRAFFKKMMTKLEAMPLDERQVASWVEQRVPVERAAAGRMRIEELWRRRSAQRDGMMNDTAAKSALKARSLDVQMAETAGVSAEGRPLPMGGEQRRGDLDAGSRAELVQPVDPSKGVERLAGAIGSSPKVDTSKSRSDAASRSEAGVGKSGRPADSKAMGQAVAGAKAGARLPPLDEWDRQAGEVAKKYGFTDAQMSKAREMLADLKKRAGRYQEAREEAFGNAEQIADAKIRAERMRLLDGPIGAMFEELKARLDSLATQEQRERAERAAKPRG